MPLGFSCAQTWKETKKVKWNFSFLAHRHERKQRRRNEISSMHFGNSERNAPKLFISEEFCYRRAWHFPIKSHNFYYYKLFTLTQTLLHYFVNFRTFFSFQKILISKLHYINEHKLIKTLSYKFLVLFSLFNYRV